MYLYYLTYWLIIGDRRITRLSYVLASNSTEAESKILSKYSSCENVSIEVQDCYQEVNFIF